MKIVTFVLGMAMVGLMSGCGAAKEAGNTATCKNNLRSIESAKEQLWMEEALPDGTIVSKAQVGQYIKDDSTWKCRVFCFSDVTSGL